MIDVSVIQVGDVWVFTPQTDQAIAQFLGLSPTTSTPGETQALVLQCAKWGLTVEAPVFLNFSPTGGKPRKIKKTFRSKRHPVIGRPL